MIRVPTNISPRFLTGNGKTNADASILGMLCIFSLLMLASYIMVMNPKALSNETTSFFVELSESKNQRFQMGHIKLGSSLADLRKLRSDAIAGVTSSGNVSAIYKDGGATYSAWYGTEGSRNFSYRVRYDNNFTNTDEDAFISEISERFGGPSTSSCNARITDGMRACKFSWWLPDAVRLDVSTRTPIKNTDHLKLTIIATDTRQIGRAHV